MSAPEESDDAGSPARLAAQYRLAEMASHPRIQIHAGKLEFGQARCSVFRIDTGTLLIGAENTIHVIVIERSGLRLDEGTYLSGYIDVTDDGTLEWRTAGAFSSFPPELTGLPMHELHDRIRGTGVRVVS